MFKKKKKIVEEVQSAVINEKSHEEMAMMADRDSLSPQRGEG